MINWMKARMHERTSWDGVILVAVGVIMLIASPLADMAAYAAVVWGAWTIWKYE